MQEQSLYERLYAQLEALSTDEKLLMLEHLARSLRAELHPADEQTYADFVEHTYGGMEESDDDNDEPIRHPD